MQIEQLLEPNSKEKKMVPSNKFFILFKPEKGSKELAVDRKVLYECQNKDAASKIVGIIKQQM